MSEKTKTSPRFRQMTFLNVMSGLEDFRVRTFRWREWVIDLGLKGSDLASFMSLLDSLQKLAPELCCSKTLRVSLARTKDEISQQSSGRWPSSGILSDGVCLTAKTSESPNQGSVSTLSGVIETGKVPEKYFLRASAAQGMLRRANRMGRPLFPFLRKALEILAATDQSTKPSRTVSTRVRRDTQARTGVEPTSRTRKRAKLGGSPRKSVKG
jgi:hypothetical protein